MGRDERAAISRNALGNEVGGEAGRGECVEGSPADVLAFCNVMSTGLGAVNSEESSSIKSWLYRLSGGCSCSRADPMSPESAFCVGGEPMELEELDRLLFGKWPIAEVEFSVVQQSALCWSLRLSLLSCDGLKVSAI